MRLIDNIKSNKYGRLISNTFIFAVGTFTSKLLVLLLMPLYTSILSTEQYGISDLLTQTANLIIPLACVGICDAIFRFAIDSEDKKKVERTKKAFNNLMNYDEKQALKRGEVNGD